ncbi:MAG TPA: hypothetical protein VFN60_00275 [Acidimicrobiales bacterium]|nr:hypothetical protein [Acidimicrobiales bacterium]
MAHLQGRGIAVELPPGFEGRILQRAPVGGGIPQPVVHLATFALPPGTADFGGGATPLMGPDDVFVVLFEFGAESVGRELFRAQGLPRSVRPSELSPFRLRRGIDGQAGGQWFFTEAGRPFTLYVVVGSFAARARLAARVGELLAGVRVEARAA